LLAGVDVLRGVDRALDVADGLEAREGVIEVTTPDVVVAVVGRLVGLDGVAPGNRRAGDAGAGIPFGVGGFHHHHRRPVLGQQVVVVGHAVGDRHAVEIRPPGVGVGRSHVLDRCLQCALGGRQGGLVVGVLGEAERDRRVAAGQSTGHDDVARGPFAALARVARRQERRLDAALAVVDGRPVEAVGAGDAQPHVDGAVVLVAEHPFGLALVVVGDQAVLTAVLGGRPF
jgi:hypothetical protein